MEPFIDAVVEAGSGLFATANVEAGQALLEQASYARGFFSSCSPQHEKNVTLESSCLQSDVSKMAMSQTLYS